MATGGAKTGPAGKAQAPNLFLRREAVIDHTSIDTLFLPWLVTRLLLPQIFHLPDSLTKMDPVVIPNARGTLPALDILSA